MGKKKSVKKLEMDNQQPSTSSSSGQKQEMAKIENGQEKKKMKEESKSEGEIQVQAEVESKCFIDELPPEMLMKILTYLNVKNLALSRLVSRKWNKITREIIKSRDEIETKFTCFKKKEDDDLSIIGRNKRASLVQFIECFAESKESPLYTRFRFKCVVLEALSDPIWTKFFSDFGQSIKFLKLEVYESIDDMTQITEKLRDLLLNQLKNLQEFGIQFPFPDFPHNYPTSSKIPLFPPETPTTSTNENQVAQFPQLPNLKVLHLNGTPFLRYAGILTDLLRASVNLQQIVPYTKGGSVKSIESFYLLQSVGKLQCLDHAHIILDTEFMTKLKNLQENSTTPLNFKLRTLVVYTKVLYKNRAFWSDASVFLSNLFESIKDTLTESLMQPIGFLPRLQLPKFSKLTILYFSKMKGMEIQVQDLPSGLNLEQVFPVLEILELQVPWTDVVPQDDENLSGLSNLKELETTGRGLTAQVVTRIGQVCPNLKDFGIGYLLPGAAIKNFREVGTAIWTHWTGLVSLDLKIDLDDPANSFPAVDSCFTGLSRQNCMLLYDLMSKAEELSKKWGSQIEFSKSGLEAERTNPSILDLKHLRNLTVRLKSSSWKKGNKDPVVSKKMLSVSERYAFQLMDNLTYKFVKARISLD